MHARLIVVLLLLTLPSAALAQPEPQPAAEPVSATGPDADGAWTLAYDVTMDAARAAALALRVRAVDDAGDETLGARDLGTARFDAGTTRFNASFLPAEGVGDYEVRLEVDGVASAPLAFRVEQGASASARIGFLIPDEPTRLSLTRDTVNADNKSKLPGDALLTRATLEDGNGLVDVERVRWHVHTDAGTAFVSGVAAWNATNLTHATIEHAFARSPIAAGSYRLTLAAERDATVLASASRTFVIREVAPTLLDAPSLQAVPDENLTLAARPVIGDRNGVDAALAVETRVYRGSVRAEPQGIVARPGTVEKLEDADGYGRAALPLAIDVPEGAAAGAYRVSLYANGSLLGSVPLEILPLPTLDAVQVNASATQVEFTLVGTGSGHATARIANATGAVVASATAAFVDGARIVLDANASEGNLSWTVELRARPDGAPVATQGGWLTASGPELRVQHPRSSARLPAAWTVTADGYRMEDATATVEVLRWDGAAASDITVRVSGGRVVLDGPASLEAGRYEVRARFAWENGTVAHATWHFEAGPWLRFSLGNATADGRTASMSFTNDGGVAIGRLVLEVDGDVAEVSLERPDGTVATAERRGGRWHVADAALAPGDTAQLRIRLPDGPLPSGARTLDLRVLALPGGGA